MALYQGSISLAKVKDGGSGTSGINTVTVYLYKRASSTPSGPTNTLRYIFSDHTLTGETSYFNGWKQSINDIGSGTDGIWIIAATATASADDAYDDILINEWSPAIEMARNGEDGQDGQDGENGYNQATVYIYRRASSVTTPAPTTDYTFSNGQFTIPANWQQEIPSTDINKIPCWVTSAVAISRGTTATLTWVTPTKLVEDGAKGDDGFSPTATVTKSGTTATITITDKNGTTTQTVTDGASGTSYYTYIRYSSKASPTSASDVSDSPTGKAYFGIQTTTSSTAPAWNDSNWHWTKYIGDDGQPGIPGVSITGARELYWLKVNTNPSQITTSTTIYDTDRQDSWTSMVPSYIANGKYYTCIETSLSNNTKYWSPPTESRGLIDANENAFVANSIAQSAEENALGAISISRATQQYFWNLTQTEGSTVAGSYITEVSEESFKSNRAAAGGYFLATSTGLELGKGSNKYAILDTSLRFYGSNQTNPLMKLSGTELIFYKSGTTNIGAKLTTTGLEISSGTILLGSTPTASVKGFKVTSDGQLTASQAIIYGTITAGANSVIGPWTVGDNAIYNPTTKSTLDSDTVDGVYLGKDGIALGKGTFKVTKAGKLTATSGQIGGWNIGTDTNKSLYYGNQTPGATTTNLVVSPTSATNSNAIGGSETGLTWFMSAGKVFGVTTAGALYSTSGKIGGWTLSANDFWKKTNGDNNGSKYFCVNANNVGGTNYVLAAATRENDAWSYKFYVNGNGKLYASDANIKGTITATSGTFKGTVNATSGYFKNIVIKDSNDATVADVTTDGMIFYNAGSARLKITNDGINIVKGSDVLATFSYGATGHGLNAALISSGYNSSGTIPIGFKVYGTSRVCLECSAMGDTGFVSFDGSYTPEPCITVKSTSSDITFNASTMTTIPFNSIYVQSHNEYISYGTTYRILSLDNSAVINDGFDGVDIEITAGAYIQPTSNTVEYAFIYIFYQKHGESTPVEVAGAGPYILYNQGVGASVQLTPRIFTNIFSGSKFFVKVRTLGGQGKVLCSHRDTYMTVRVI